MSDSVQYMGDPKNKELAMELSRPLTPRSERPRASYGSISVSVQTVKGLCQKTAKCYRKAGHDGNCLGS